MYQIYVRCNYKRTLWFKSKVFNKKNEYIKLSTKTKNLIKTYTYLKKALRICRAFKKQHKLSCLKMLRHYKLNKFIFQLKSNNTQNVY